MITTDCDRGWAKWINTSFSFPIMACFVVVSGVPGGTLSCRVVKAIGRNAFQVFKASFFSFYSIFNVQKAHSLYRYRIYVVKSLLKGAEQGGRAS